jgi:hypothetical protein
MKRELISIIITLILLLISICAVAAANDPGHDTLYIEQQGDSELNGTLNITNNLSLQSTSKVKQGGVLTLYADGSTPATGTYISATGDSEYKLYLDTSGNVYIKNNIGGGMVYIGKTGSTPTGLNVSGALFINGSNNQLSTGAAGSASNLNLYWGDKLICNASLSNCGWASSITGGGNITGAGTPGAIAKFTAAGAIGNSIISESGNTLTINGNISMPDNFYIGAGATATGAYATALGRFSEASGGQSVAIGGASATYQGATAVGAVSQALAQYATVFGYNSRALSEGAIVIGGWSDALGQYSIGMGYAANASAHNSIAIGYGAQSTAMYATAIGNGIVNDVYNSTKLGGKVILSGEMNATSHNVTSVSCIVFDTGGKICSGA